ncbi:MAG: YraN family protein [Chloroflexota bacterium]
MNERGVGKRGETIAREHLQSLGYRILDHNWRSSEGEIDLVAQDGETIVFVEVKARTSRRFGHPEDAVTRRKSRRLQRAGLAYLEAHDLLDAPWRIDVLAVDLLPDGSPARLEHYPDAVDGERDLEP